MRTTKTLCESPHPAITDRVHVACLVDVDAPGRFGRTSFLASSRGAETTKKRAIKELLARGNILPMAGHRSSGRRSARKRRAWVAMTLALALAILTGCGNRQSAEERANEGLTVYGSYRASDCKGIGNNKWMCTVENDGKRARLPFAEVAGNPGLTLYADPCKLPGGCPSPIGPVP
jgi:hypothetical protein